MLDSVGRYRETLGNFVQAEGTAAVPAPVCWKRASHGLCVESGDLLNWPEDKKEKRTFKLETFGCHSNLKREKFCIKHL